MLRRLDDGGEGGGRMGEKEIELGLQRCYVCKGLARGREKMLARMACGSVFIVELTLLSVALELVD